MSKTRVASTEPLILNRLASIMKEKRWNNKRLAEKLGYDPATISQWANNRVQPLTATMARIALILDVNLPDFYIDTVTLDKSSKDRYLSELQVIANRSKRVGQHKTKKSSTIKTKRR